MWHTIQQQVKKLLDAQNGLHSAFDWQGATIKGVRTTLRREDVATDAGLFGYYSFSVICSALDFEGKTLPRPRLDKLTIDGKAMRVLAVERDSVNACIKIHLGDDLA